MGVGIMWPGHFFHIPPGSLPSDILARVLVHQLLATGIDVLQGLRFATAPEEINEQGPITAVPTEEGR